MTAQAAQKAALLENATARANEEASDRIESHLLQRKLEDLQLRFVELDKKCHKEHKRAEEIQVRTKGISSSKVIKSDAFVREAKKKTRLTTFAKSCSETNAEGG